MSVGKGEMEDCSAKGWVWIAQHGGAHVHGADGMFFAVYMEKTLGLIVEGVVVDKGFAFEKLAPWLSLRVLVDGPMEV